MRFQNEEHLLKPDTRRFRLKSIITRAFIAIAVVLVVLFIIYFIFYSTERIIFSPW